GRGDRAGRLGDGVDGLAERDAGREVETQRDRRELSLVRDRQRPDLAGIDVHQGGQRHRAAGQWRFHVETVERGQVLLLFRQDFENDPVGLELGEILRDLALAERIVERVVDALRRYAETRG